MSILDKMIKSLGAGRASVRPAADVLNRTPSHDPSPQADAGRTAEGGGFIASLRAIDDRLSAFPNDAGSWSARALALLRTGRAREALESCEHAFAAGAGDAAIRSRFGWANLRLGDLAAAEQALREAAALEPRAWKARFDLAIARLARADFEGAARTFGRALELQPSHFESVIGLADCALAEGRNDDAEAMARRALTLDARQSSGWIHLGVALERQGRFDDAIDALARAERIEESSTDRREGFVNLGICLLEAGRVDEAIEVFRRNLPQSPTVRGHFLYAISLLTNGQFAEGWDQYDFRLLRTGALALRAKVARPVWDGQSLRGRTVLLRSEQGLGDAIQFLRYAPLLKERGATVLLHPHGTLGKLARRFSGIDQVIEEGFLPHYDFHIPLMSLPRAFDTDLTSIPAGIPYVSADPADADRWEGRLQTRAKTRIGLVWAGSADHVKDRFRSVPLSVFAPLAAMDDVQFFSLQKGDRASEADRPPAGLRLANLSGEIANFTDTAAIISRLDLVISVDTAVAHLAGAMGKPVWVLLPKPADWRWLQERGDSPWYPTMRLFRQARRGDWSSVIDAVHESLSRIAAPNAAPPPEASGEPLADVPGTTGIQPPSEPPIACRRLCRVAETRAGILQYLPDDEPIGKSIRIYGEYLHAQIELVERLIRPGAIVAEMGADIGIHTLALAQAVGDSGHVFACEPRLPHRFILEQNLSANGAGNVTVVWPAKGGPSDDRVPDGITIAGVDELSLTRLDLLKIDSSVGGVDTIEGASETLWRLRPIVLASAASEAEAVDVATAIQAFGYRCWRTDMPLFDANNFNLRSNDEFAGRVVVGLLAVPEEVELDSLPPRCVPLTASRMD